MIELKLQLKISNIILTFHPTITYISQHYVIIGLITIRIRIAIKNIKHNSNLSSET